MDIKIHLASEQHSNDVLPLMRAYHKFDGILLTDIEREVALRPLLGENPQGCVWLASQANQYIGYIIICFGYSVEFKGRDAFVDELYIAESYRHQGAGGQLLSHVQTAVQARGIKALHLEVARTNASARHFYTKAGFNARENFMLMSCKLSKS